MKTSNTLALAIVTLFGGTLHAADSNRKPDAAQKLVERITPAQPPCVSTGTVRTPEQAIREYRASGKAPGVSFKTKPVPAPGR